MDLEIIFREMSFELKILGYDIPEEKLSELYQDGIFNFGTIIKENNLNILPISSLKSFTSINLHDCKLYSLPKSIGNLVNLTKLHFEYSRFSISEERI